MCLLQVCRYHAHVATQQSGREEVATLPREPTRANERLGAERGTQMTIGNGKVSRRSVLRGAGAAAGVAAGSGAITGFPTIWAQNIKDVVLNHAGPPVTAIPAIAEQATKDLGFTVHMQASENADLLNRFLSQSSAIDCADVSLVYMRYLIGRDVLQAIPLSKFKYWDKTIPLLTKGEYPDGRKAPQQGITPDDDPVRHRSGRPEGHRRHAHRIPHRHSHRHQRRHAWHPTRSGGPRDRLPGPICWRPNSRAGPHCRTILPSASSMSPWRWRHAATSSTATRAT